MKPISRLVAGLAVFLLAITIFANVVSASGPIAVYALIDKVTLEPNSDHPQRILIYGVFSTAQSQNGSTYSKPQRGYLCFSLPPHIQMPNPSNPQDPQLALREWSDLQSVAGTRQVVGFGSAWHGKVRVRQSPTEAANDPDVYTLNFGVKKLDASNANAKPLLDYKDR
jgi:hypothetical protein